MHVSVCLNVYLGPAEVRRGHQMLRNWRYVGHLVGTGAQTRRSARRAGALITESMRTSGVCIGFLQTRHLILVLYRRLRP